jgi:hypothetical protein
MNERIRQLAQAYLEHERFDRLGESTQEDHYVFYPDELAEFVRVIVEECADLYNHEDVLAPIGMSARGEAHQHGWIEGTKTYRDTILEHFGVEE